MAGIAHDQSVNKVVADSHDDVINGEELNQENNGGEGSTSLNGKKTFSESELEINTGVSVFEGADLQMAE